MIAPRGGNRFRIAKKARFMVLCNPYAVRTFSVS